MGTKLCAHLKSSHVLLLGSCVTLAVACGGGSSSRKAGPDEPDAAAGGAGMGGARGGGGPGGGGGTPAAGGTAGAGGGPSTGGTAATGGVAGGDAGSDADAGVEGGADATTDADPGDSGAAVVEPLYATSGPYWNDYVKADGTTRFDASDTACDPVNDGPRYDACLHGGELRRVELHGLGSCNGLTATDALGAFDWTCLDDGGVVRVVSTGLKTGKNLADLIDFAELAFRLNSVTVTGGASPVTTEPAVWWENPVKRDVDGIPFGTALVHDVYVTRAGDTGLYRPNGDKVALVVEPGTTLSGTVDAGGGHFRWFEGAIDAGTGSLGFHAGDGAFNVIRGISATGSGAHGVHLSGLRASVVTDVVAVSNAEGGNATASNVRIESCAGMRIRGIASSASAVMGVFFQALTDSVVENVTSTSDGGGVQSPGIRTLSTSGNVFRNLTASSTTAGPGISLESGTGEVFETVRTDDTARAGLFLLQQKGALLTDVTVTRVAVGRAIEVAGTGTERNTFQRVRVADGSTNETAVLLGFRDVLQDAIVAGAGSSSSNASVSTSGGENILVNVQASGALEGFSSGSTSGGRHVFINVTAVNNTTNGFNLRFGGPMTLMNVVSANNGTGIDTRGSVGSLSTSPPNVFHNLVSANNTAYGVIVGNGAHLFSGLFRVGANGTADCSATGTYSGLDSACNLLSPSNATPGTGALSGSFVGKVASDTVNPSGATGVAAYDSITDFSSFGGPGRSWGREGTGAFPQPEQRGRCSTGETCRVWDFDLLATDASARAIAPVPTGNDTVTHVWADIGAAITNQAGCDATRPGSVFVAGTPNRCASTFLKSAVENAGDGVGNDNGLCESGETCVHSPNAGSYQGHGDLVSAGAFTDGTITGVTLLRHAINGR